MPRCPDCRLLLDPIDYERVRIYNCGSCGGNWVDAKRLDVIVERREESWPEAVKEKIAEMTADSAGKNQRWCWTCQTPMVKEQFRIWPDIQLDRCPKCDGIWLDRGRLEEVQILWEYLQDHPLEGKAADLLTRKLLIEAELNERRAGGREARRSEESVATFIYNHCTRNGA